VLSVHSLVGFSEFAKGGERVGSKLVQDTGDEFGEFFVNAVAVDCEGVGRLETVDCLSQGERGKGKRKKGLVGVRMRDGAAPLVEDRNSRC